VSYIEYDRHGTVISQGFYLQQDAEEQPLAEGSGSVTPPENTKAWGPMFHFCGPIPPKKWFLSVMWIREITDPWRRGLGVGVRGTQKFRGFGLWFRGRAPEPVQWTDESLLGNIDTTRLSALRNLDQ